MGLLTSRHCGQQEPHEKHQGRFVWPQCGPGPHLVCDGDPAHLARQLKQYRYGFTGQRGSEAGCYG